MPSFPKGGPLRPSARTGAPSYLPAQEVNIMTEKEQATSMIAKYMDLLRIEKAENRDREIKNQLRETKAMLEALGVVVEDLVIE